MYSQTKKHFSRQSKLFFIILFILNFNSLRTQLHHKDGHHKDDHHKNNKNLINSSSSNSSLSSLSNSSCIDCINKSIESNLDNLNKKLNISQLLNNQRPINRSILNRSIHNRFLVNRSINDRQLDKRHTDEDRPKDVEVENQTNDSIQIDNQTNNPSTLTTRTSSNYLSKSTLDLDAIQDSISKIQSTTHRRQLNSRKKQLDSELESSQRNVKSNLNLDETDESIEKEKLKQNIDKQSSNRQTVKEIEIQLDKELDKEKELTKEIGKNEDSHQLNKQQPNQYSGNQFNEQQRNADRNEHTRRLNEQINNRRLLKNQRQAHSSYSILRKFHPVNQNVHLENVNKYSFEDARLATLEIAKLQKNGRCKFPSKRVIPINKLLSKNMHLKKIMPHCTILHRCEPDTGCCSSDSEHCTVIKQEKVRLPFWVIELSSDGQQFKTIEWHNFFNHTECGCEMKPSIK